MSKLGKLTYQQTIEGLCRANGFPLPEFEWAFAKPRRWRFDAAWVFARCALEIEGGIFIQGRHSRGVGMLKDMEKYNTAAALGWRIVRCTPTTLLTGFEFVQKCIPRP